MVAEANKYLSDQAPWKLKTSDPDRMATVLHVALQAVERLQHAAHAVPAALRADRCTSCSAAPACSRRMPEIVRGRRPRRRARLPGAHRRLRRRGARWESRADRRRARRCSAPTPVFTQARPVDRGRGAGPARAGVTARAGDGDAPPAPEPLPVAGASTATATSTSMRAGDGRRGARWPRAAVGVDPGRARSAATLPSSRWSVRDWPRRTPSVVADGRPAPQRGAAAGADRRPTRWPRSPRWPRRPAGAGGRRDRARLLPHRRRTAGAQQEESFRAHIAMAKRHGKALVIHDRDAHDDVLRVLDEEGAPDTRRLPLLLRRRGDGRSAASDRGYVLSFAGTVTFKNAADLRAAAAVAPLDQLLVETDAPFLTPMPYRGRPNAPYLVPLTVRAMAEGQVSTRTPLRARSPPAPRRPSAPGSRVPSSWSRLSSWVSAPGCGSQCPPS